MSGSSASECLYIAPRRKPEHSGIFTAELGWAFIPNFEGGRFDSGGNGKHEAPCFEQPQLFLILKRRHRC